MVPDLNTPFRRSPQEFATNCLRVGLPGFDDFVRARFRRQNYIADFARRITARRLVLRPSPFFALFTAARALRLLPPRPATLLAV